jgi:hypothetical protein
MFFRLIQLLKQSFRLFTGSEKTYGMAIIPPSSPMIKGYLNIETKKLKRKLISICCEQGAL